MNKLQLYRKMARLESINDQLETEISDLDLLLRTVGFPQGLVSVKEVAEDLIENGELEDSSSN